MARTLSSALHIARGLLSAAHGWLMFVEITRPVEGRYFRLVDHPRSLVANGLVWQASAISVAIPEETIEGSLGQLTLTVSNVSGIPLSYVESGNELLGQRVRVWLTHTGNLASFSPGLMWEHTGSLVNANAKALTLTCRHPATGKRVPSVRFTRANFPQLLPQGGRGSIGV